MRDVRKRPSLPLSPPARRRRGKPESDSVYAAVCWLRKKGHRVICAGNDTHVVDSRRVTSLYLIATAKAEGMGSPDA